jgi:hypothetical protein
VEVRIEGFEVVERKSKGKASDVGGSSTDAMDFEEYEEL